MNRLGLYLVALAWVLASCTGGARAARACGKAGKGAGKAAPAMPAGYSDDLLRGTRGSTDELIGGTRGDLADDALKGATGSGADDVGAAARHGDDLAGEAADVALDVVDLTDLVVGEDDDDEGYGEEDADDEGDDSAE